MEYGIDRGDHVVRGPDWRCIADVVAAAHGIERRLTGVLVRRVGDGPWQVVDLG